jgi:MSHA biogenesis protein MshJ
MAHESWRRIEARVAAMSVRERLLIVVAAGVVMLALLQTLLLDALARRDRVAQERVDTATRALEGIAAQKRALVATAGRDPDAAAKSRLAELVARLAALDADLARRQATLIAPERMPQVLKDVVRAQGGIEITALDTLTPEGVPLPGAAEGARPGFYRHGLTITVRGRYPDLVGYLARIEDLPWRFAWREATLDTSGRPLLALTVTLYTLSLEETWLAI